MKRLVIDASIAIKWIVPEQGTIEALDLMGRREILAPDLLLAECANIIWKKVARGNLLRDQALAAIDLVEELEVELVASRGLFARATELALELNHPAYDCFYLALAESENAPFVTVDERLIAKLRTAPLPSVQVLTLTGAAGTV